MTTDEKIDLILQEVSGIKPMVQDHHKTLYGNGRAGLKDRMTVIEQKQKSCVAVKAHGRSNVMLAIQVIVVAIAIASLVISYNSNT
jgi:hypothetical protein